MLARANRLVAGDDYKRLVRRGRRSSTAHAVLYVSHNALVSPARFGFIVPKAVGGAVDRNLVRRRLKAIASERLDFVQPGTDVVIRALPGAAQLGWDSLRAEIFDVLDKGVTRA